MSAIHELGNALRTRRTEMGLSQALVAALSGQRSNHLVYEKGSPTSAALMEWRAR